MLFIKDIRFLCNVISSEQKKTFYNDIFKHVILWLWLLCEFFISRFYPFFNKWVHPPYRHHQHHPHHRVGLDDLINPFLAQDWSFVTISRFHLIKLLKPYNQVVKYVTYYDDLPYYQNSYSHSSHHHSYHDPVSYTIDRQDDIDNIDRSDDDKDNMILYNDESDMLNIDTDTTECTDLSSPEKVTIFKF